MERSPLSKFTYLIELGGIEAITEKFNRKAQDASSLNLNDGYFVIEENNRSIQFISSYDPELNTYQSLKADIEKEVQESYFFAIATFDDIVLKFSSPEQSKLYVHKLLVQLSNLLSLASNKEVVNEYPIIKSHLEELNQRFNSVKSLYNQMDSNYLVEKSINQVEPTVIEMLQFLRMEDDDGNAFLNQNDFDQIVGDVTDIITMAKLPDKSRIKKVKAKLSDYREDLDFISYLFYRLYKHYNAYVRKKRALLSNLLSDYLSYKFDNYSLEPKSIRDSWSFGDKKNRFEKRIDKLLEMSKVKKV